MWNLTLNNRETDIESIKTEFMKGKNRGPENSQFLNLTSINLDFIDFPLMDIKMITLINLSTLIISI